MSRMLWENVPSGLNFYAWENKMSKKFNTWEGRRALTDNYDSDPKALPQVARDLIKLNQLSEAASLAVLIGDQEILREIAGLASEEGNFFLFNYAWSRLQDKDVGRDLVRTLKEVAEKNGKALYQEQAVTWLAENS